MSGGGAQNARPGRGGWNRGRPASWADRAGAGLQPAVLEAVGQEDQGGGCRDEDVLSRAGTGAEEHGWGRMWISQVAEAMEKGVVNLKQPSKDRQQHWKAA